MRDGFGPVRPLVHPFRLKPATSQLEMMTTSAAKATTVTAAERRRLAKLAARIEQWWRNVPDSARLPFYGLTELAAACRAPGHQLGPVLRAHGWLRVQVRLGGIAGVVWVPPGYPSPLRAVGRPRTRTRPAPAPSPDPTRGTP